MVTEPRVFLTTDAVGGVWTHTRDLARGFAARGAIVTIAVLGPPPDIAQRADLASIAGASLIETDEPLDWCMAAPGALSRCAAHLAERAAGHTTIHLHSPALLGDADWPAPVLATIHSCVATWWRAVRGTTAMPEALAWQAETTRLGLARAAAVIAPSHAFAGAVRETYALQRPLIVVPNGSGIHPPAPSMRRSGVLTAGRLWDEGKNIKAVDRAAARLAASFPAMPVIAAGALTGPNGASIALRHARAMGQMDAAQLAGLMAKLAVFAAPACYEPFGLAILEAAGAGMALVLGDIPTLRELWNDAALFVDPADDAALAAMIAHLHAEPELAAIMGAKARVRAARYDAGTMIATLWNLHARMVHLPALEVA
jgi:glycosyltransferase involved in cell wall biosynthesis